MSWKLGGLRGGGFTVSDWMGDSEIGSFPTICDGVVSVMVVKKLLMIILVLHN